MNDLEIKKLSPESTLRLPDSLSSAATFTALDAWSRLVEETYGHNIHRFEATAAGQTTGILILTEVRHPIFGHYLATSPFGSYGGFAYSSLVVRDRLLEQARDLANVLGVEHVNVRFDAGEESPPTGWVQSPVYATYRVDLLPDVEKMTNSFSSDHRNHVRKSMKRGFSIEFGRLDVLADAYEGIALSMHELGSPYHGEAYFRRMMDAFGEDLEFAVLYNSAKELAGAGVFISHGGVVTNLHANILRKFRSEYAGEYLYWSAMERYAAKGMQVFDLGRSLINSGNESFKMKWKPRKVPLAYWYFLPGGGPIPQLNQKSPKFQLAIAVWKKLPAFLVRSLGPGLIRGIV